MKIKPNKKPEYFGVATSFLMTTTLHAVGISPINVTLSSGVGTNIINTSIGQNTVVEYKIQDVIGRPPSRTWLWSSPNTPYIKRVNSVHAPDCSTYNQPNTNPKSFQLPPSGVCYFALEVSGTQFANTSSSKKATYRPVFANSGVPKKIAFFDEGAIEYGPCLSEQLQITLVNPITPPTPIISVGTYISSTTQRPLLVVSQDLGDNWIYPEVINAPVFQPTNPNQFDNNGVFFGASCNSSLCIAVGKGEDTDNHNRPLLAQSKDAGSTWLYPQPVNDPIFTPASSVPFQPATTSTLSAASCNDTLCFAVGSYRSIRRPLLTYTPDLGNSWIFPGNVTTPVFTPNTHPYLEDGELMSASCSNSVCVAVGRYTTNVGTPIRPLLVQSQNSGNSWDYPGSITDPVLAPDTYDNYGNFTSVSCTGTTCVAVGSYESPGLIRRPLLAVTNDSGSNWSYDNSVTTPIFTAPATYPFVGLGIFNAVSCISTTCVAGGYYNDGVAQRPLLAVSQDLGNTWVFPFSITAPDFIPGNPFPYNNNGTINSVSCTSSICIAVGTYFDAGNVQRPLLAQSLDSGSTWEYPASITNPSFVPFDYFSFDNNGQLYSAKCNEEICIASGTYFSSSLTTTTPLIVTSKDKGVTWEYPAVITDIYFEPNNNNAFSSDGVFYGIGASPNGAFLPDSLQFIKPKLVPNRSRSVPLK